MIILFPAIPRGIENMDDFINQVMEAVQSPNEFSQDPTEEIAPIIQLEIDAFEFLLGFHSRNSQSTRFLTKSNVSNYQTNRSEFNPINRTPFESPN